MRADDSHSFARDSASAARPARITECAADWLARRGAGLTVEEQTAFSAWLLADPRHAAAAAEIDQAWSRLQQPRLAGKGSALLAAIDAQVARRTRRTRRRVAAVIGLPLAAAAVVMLCFLPFRQASAPASAAVLTAAADTPEWRRLPDGSFVELNAGAEIATDFSPDRRSVRLLRGEAHFAVTKDPQRPFVVTAGRVAIRAVGTEFAVQLAAGDVDVLVTEGRVAVERAAERPLAPSAVQPAEAVLAFVDAGNSVSLPAEAPPAVTPRFSPVSPSQVQSALAWRSRRVEFSDTPLTDVVAHFNRRNTIQLQVANAEVGQIRVGGVFWADDPEALARLLETSTGIRADFGTPGRILLRH